MEGWVDKEPRADQRVPDGPGPCSIPSGDNTTIYIPDGSCDPIGLVGKEEADDVGYVIRGSDSPDGMKRVERSQYAINFLRVNEGSVNGGLDHGGRNRVDSDMMVRQLHGQVLSERM